MYIAMNCHCVVNLLVIQFIISLITRGEADQLLADIDDMLADLNTHLDFMIPGADEGTQV